MGCISKPRDQWLSSHIHSTSVGGFEIGLFEFGGLLGIFMFTWVKAFLLHVLENSRLTLVV
jgi:hypothetical protein